MIAHKAEGEEAPFGKPGAEAEQTEELDAVVVVAVDVATVDPAHRDVVGAVLRKVVTRSACHGGDATERVVGAHRRYRQCLERPNPGDCPHGRSCLDVADDRAIHGRSCVDMADDRAIRVVPRARKTVFEARYARSSPYTPSVRRAVSSHE